MTNKAKILDFIYSKLKFLDTDWRPDLERLNVWEDVEGIYDMFYEEKKSKVLATNLQSNTIFAFIVLSYDQHSLWLEHHKDRFENKTKIITRLAGPSALDLNLYNDLVYSMNLDCNKVINWYINYQKDSRWQRIISSKEYSSKANSLAMDVLGSPKDGVDIGKMLAEADLRDEAANKLLDILRGEYMILDAILEKEKRPRATDMEQTNFMSHEGFIRARDKRLISENNKKEEEKDLEKENKKKKNEKADAA